MKQKFFTKTELFRCMAMLLLALCGYVGAAAQSPATQADVNAYIIDSPIPVTFTNDKEHPWYIYDYDDMGESRKVLRVSNERDSESDWDSTISFTYTSKYPTLIYRNFYQNGGQQSYRIDDEAEWHDWESNKEFPAGTHTISIRWHNYGWNGTDSYANLEYFRVIEKNPEIGNACLAPGSLPIKFVNDSDNPWVVCDGYVSPWSENKGTAKLTATVTVDKKSIFSYELEYGAYSGKVSVDDQLFFEGHIYDGKNSVLLQPGTHTIVFEGGGDVRLSNVCLSQDFYDVKVGKPGEFGPTLVSLLNGKKLSEAEYVKISGELNESDWLSISQLSNVKAIDMTNAKITEIPSRGFFELSSLRDAILPNGIVTIGEYAFYATNLHQITIPSSVKRIEGYAFSGIPLQILTFSDNSSLKYIGQYAFSSTALREVDMPDSVEELGNQCFFLCHSLEKMHISKSVTRLPTDFASYYSWTEYYKCGHLKSIELPEGLIEIEGSAFRKSRLESITIPKNVKNIGPGAFEGCHNLKEITLNSHTHDLISTFSGCDSIRTINLPCAVPPAVNMDGTNDPFDAIDKGDVNLYVPAFALYDYRMDPYWFQFIKMKSSTETTNSDYWAIYGHLKLNASNTIPGKPTVEIAMGGILDVATGTPLNTDYFIFDVIENAPSVFLNESNSVKADHLMMDLRVEDTGKWYFFSPAADVKVADIRYSTTDSWKLCYYDGGRRFSEDTSYGNWIEMPADGTLKRGQGYIFRAAEEGVLYLNFAEAEKNKFLAITEFPMAFDSAPSLSDENEYNGGWHFFANPFPAFYDIYFMNLNAPITVWDGGTYRSYSLTDDDFILSPLQPFFVQRSSDAANIAMPRTGRQATTLLTRQKAPEVMAADAARQRLDLEIACGDNENADDYTRVVLNEKASLAFEGALDASKIMSMDENKAQLYTLGGNAHALAINERPYADGNVALGVKIPVAGQTYRIAATRADRQAWIYDAYEGIEQDLTAADYIFTAERAGADESRFSLRFAPEANGVAAAGMAAAKVKGETGAIAISAPEGAAISVFGADGSVVATATANGAAIEISAPAGVYIVKIDGQSFKTIVK